MPLRGLLGLWLLLPGIALAGSDRVCLAQSARAQIGVTVRYDPAYTRMAYPGGDVASDRGVCTDVVIRAYRALGLDLQQLVHEDMRAHFGAYPRNWGLQRPDANIDHRRVPNLATFFARHGSQLAIPGDDAEWLAGDLVTWRLPSGVPHIGIISERKSAAGVPLVIHNIGLGTREEDMLHAFSITGAFRYRPGALAQACPTTP